MGDVRLPEPVLAVAAVFSRYDDAFEWARQRCAANWGPIVLASEPIEFRETPYYERTMGEGIRKCLWAFERLIDPAQLVDYKLQANDWEEEYRRESNWPEPRPLNIDPGYLTEAKLVLGTTKDRDHRLYLDRGIYAENTLFFQRGEWRARDWTYPDYRRSDYHEFFTRCRDYLRLRYGRP